MTLSSAYIELHSDAEPQRHAETEDAAVAPGAGVSSEAGVAASAAGGSFIWQSHA